MLFASIVLVPLLFAETLAPFFIDGLCGHIWGSVVAVLNIGLWMFFVLKRPLAPSTRFIMLIPLAVVVLVAILEFAHLFRWRL